MFLYDGGQESVQVEDRLVGERANGDLLFRAVQRELTNRRQGNHATKTRGEVTGSGRKPWRQKGTGRARAGSFKSPLWRGGGTIFGPQPREYRQEMPRKMRRKALRLALSEKYREGELALVDRLPLQAPKTKEGRKFLERIEHGAHKTLIVCAHDENNLAVRKSFSNLPGVRVLPSALVTVYALLGCERVLFTQDALNEMAERI
jgi:large subunit ribosomal protein L4